MQLSRVVETSARVAATTKRLEKIGLIATLLRELSKAVDAARAGGDGTQATRPTLTRRTASVILWLRTSGSPACFSTRRSIHVRTIDEVIGITVERCVFAGLVGGKIGLPGSDLVEEHRAKVIAECRFDEAPHILVTTEPMGENHRRRTGSIQLDIVALQNVHFNSFIKSQAMQIASFDRSDK